MKNNFFLTFPIIFLIISYACLDPEIYQGRSELLNRSIDLSLNDSSLVYGKVLRADQGDPAFNASVNLNDLSQNTFSNDTGYYEIKMLPGNYDIYAKQDDNQTTFTDLDILPNEEVEINFYIKVIIN